MCAADTRSVCDSYVIVWLPFRNNQPRSLCLHGQRLKFQVLAVNFKWKSGYFVVSDAKTTAMHIGKTNGGKPTAFFTNSPIFYQFAHSPRAAFLLVASNYTMT